MDIPPDAIAAARAAQAQTGASDHAAALALAVAFPESGYDPNAEGDWMLGGHLVGRGTPGAIPTSFGYTQLHNADGGDGGGLGNGYSAAQLKDPVLNFTIAESGIQSRLDAGAGDLEAIGPWSTRHTAINLVGETAVALASQGSSTVSASVFTSGGADPQSWLVPAAVILAALWVADVI